MDNSDMETVRKILEEVKADLGKCKAPGYLQQGPSTTVPKMQFLEEVQPIYYTPSQPVTLQQTTYREPFWQPRQMFQPRSCCYYSEPFDQSNEFTYSDDDNQFMRHEQYDTRCVL